MKRIIDNKYIGGTVIAICGLFFLVSVIYVIWNIRDLTPYTQQWFFKDSPIDEWMLFFITFMNFTCVAFMFLMWLPRKIFKNALVKVENEIFESTIDKIIEKKD